MSEIAIGTEETKQPSIFKGDINLVSKDVIKGWALNLNDISTPVQIVLEDEAGASHTYLANLARADLKELSIGTGFHGFEIVPPEHLIDGNVHELKLSILKSNHVLNRGNFRFGPYYEEKNVSISSIIEDLLSSREFTWVKNDIAFTQLAVKSSVAVQMKFEFADVSADANVRLNFYFSADYAGKKFAIHTQQSGYRKKLYVDLKPVSDGERIIWEGNFKLNKMLRDNMIDASFVGKDIVVSIGINISNKIDDLLGNDNELNHQQSFVKINSIIFMRDLSPPIVTVLDNSARKPSVNNESFECILPSKPQKMLHKNISSCIKSYFNPTIVAFADDVTIKNLNYVSNTHRAEFDTVIDLVSNVRPDLLIVSYETMSESAINGNWNEDIFHLALKQAAISGCKTICIFDTIPEPRLDEQVTCTRKFDLVINLTELQDDYFYNFLEKSQYARSPVFISPGRLGVFSDRIDADFFLRQATDESYILNGFWGLENIKQYVDSSFLKNLMDKFVIIDMFFTFSIYRTLDIESFYWNLLGSVDADQRLVLMQNNDAVFFSSIKSLPSHMFKQTMLEAVLLGCLPATLHNTAETISYEGFNYLLNSLPETNYQKDKTRIQYFHSVFSNSNSVDFISKCLQNHRVGMIANNAAAIMPSICVVLVSKRPHMLNSAIDLYKKQNYENKSLVIVLHGNFGTADQEKGWIDSGVVSRIYRVCESKTLGYCINRAAVDTGADYIAKWDDDDLYGANHLRDFSRYLQICNVDVFVRPLGFVYNCVNKKLNFLKKARNHTFKIYNKSNWQGFNGAGGTLIVKKSIMDVLRFSETRRGGLDSDFARRAIDNDLSFVSGDPFNFALCRYGSEGGHTWHIDDAQFDKMGELLGYHSLEECYDIIST